MGRKSGFSSWNVREAAHNDIVSVSVVVVVVVVVVVIC